MNILTLMITLAILFAMAFFFYKTLNMYPEESIAMAVMSILVLIYITGVMGDTRIALYITYAVAMLGALQFILNRRFIRKQSNSVARRDFFSPGIVVLILGCIYAMVAFGNILLINWDELSQWGKAASYMVLNNALPTGENFDGADVILSSTTFFHYFISKITATITENICEGQYYISNFILWFSAVILPLSGMKWKNAKRGIVYIFIIFLSMNVLFVQPYYNIYCDQACAVWAGALIGWYLFGKKSKYWMVLVPLILWNVGLFKNMVGLLFDLIIILVIALHSFMILGDTFKERLAGLKEAWKKRYALYGLILCAMPVLPTMIWSAIIKTNAVVRTGAAVVADQGDKVPLTLKSAVQKVFTVVCASNSLPRISYFSFFVIAIIISILLYKYCLAGRLKKSCGCILALYCAGFVLYWVVLVYAYLTIFGYADSVSTASMERYFSNYMMMGIIPLLLPFFLEENIELLDAEQQKMTKRIGLIIFLIMCLGIQDNFAGRTTGWYLYREYIYEDRADMKEYKKRLRHITGGEGKIYMICQDEQMFPVVVADYEMGLQLDREGMPYYFQDENKKVVDIAGLNERGIKEFQDIIEENEYEYLWIYKRDKFFTDYIKEEFELDKVRNGDVYRIEKNADGEYTLSLIKNIKIKSKN